MRKKIVLLLGAPCSGKGTQGQRINKYIECISAGEILRKKYPKGTKEREELDSGKLIDVDKVNTIMLDYIKSHDFRVVLDGYPRSIDQANFIKIVHEQYNVPIDVIVLDTNDHGILQNRMHCRTYCDICGNTFDKLLKCCNKVTTKRSDDNIETFQERLKVYESNINEILKLFDSKYILNAYEDVEVLAAEIKRIIDK